MTEKKIEEIKRTCGADAEDIIDDMNLLDAGENVHGLERRHSDGKIFFDGEEDNEYSDDDALEFIIDFYAQYESFNREAI